MARRVTLWMRLAPKTWTNLVQHIRKERASDRVRSEDSFGFAAFAKNGCFQGIAYHLRSRGAFSPSVSLFTHGKVEPATTVAFNFGPDFLAQVQFGDLVSQILCRCRQGMSSLRVLRCSNDTSAFLLVSLSKYKSVHLP